MQIHSVLLMALFISACSPRLLPVPEPTQIPPTKHLDPVIATPDSSSDKMASLAIQDLSSRLALDSNQIHLLSAESTLWADRSLGCPRPGEVYAQGTVRGYRFHLEANGQEYIYHTDTIDTVILCSEEDLSSCGGVYLSKFTRIYGSRFHKKMLHL